VRGHQLTTDLLRRVYEDGAFPMAEPDGSVEFYVPYRRCLMPIEGIHVSRSLSRVIRQGEFEIRFDTNFEGVMRGCMVRAEGTWISEDFIRVYGEAFREGWAHCCETWKDGKLVGGIYGLAIGTCFCAESMFHRETNASKVAIWAMVNRCREAGFTLFDAQLMNPHLASLGAFEVPHEAYLISLSHALRNEAHWPSE
jgi:leucyl/phenylalanyl-tRNA--protein transferase